MHRSHLEKDYVLQMLSHSTNRVIFLEASAKRALKFSLPAFVPLNKSTKSKAKSYSYEISTHEISGLPPLEKSTRVSVVVGVFAIAHIP